MKKADLALKEPKVLTTPQKKHLNRNFQGIPGIEISTEGRLWLVWYSGGEDEGPENHVLIKYSDDHGQTWSEPQLIIDPIDKVRAFDPVLWYDPENTLWLFWCQSYDWYDGRAGVWAMKCDNSDSDNLNWTDPVRLTDGIMLNKPTVISTGHWLLPVAVWDRKPFREDMADKRFSNVYISRDNGDSWTFRGQADVPERVFDEHKIIEKNDGSLWMLVRTKYGIGQSFSYDKGREWTAGTEYMKGPSTRFHLRRLPSGKLLLIYHYNTKQRNNMAAFISEDDGESWNNHLLLDERSNISYPDATVDEDGLIYAVYDRQRHKEKEILMSVFREEDIEKGEFVSEEVQSRVVIEKA